MTCAKDTSILDVCEPAPPYPTVKMFLAAFCQCIAEFALHHKHHVLPPVASLTHNWSDDDFGYDKDSTNQVNDH